MDRMVSITVVTAFVFSMGGLGAAPALAGAQQEKMKTCNEEARKKELHGDERRKFMSECLSSKAADHDKKVAQHEKDLVPQDKEKEKE